MLDMIDRLGMTLDFIPTGTGDIPHLPMVLLVEYTRRSVEEGLVTVPIQQGPLRIAAIGPTAVVADGQTDRQPVRDRDLGVPADVIQILATSGVDGAAWHHAVVIERAPIAQVEKRLAAHFDHSRRIIRVGVEPADPRAVRGVTTGEI